MRTGKEERALVLAIETDVKRRGSFTALAKKLNLRVNRVADFREAIDCMMSSSYQFFFIHVESDDVEALACIKTMRLNAARLGRRTAIIATVSGMSIDGQNRLRACGVSEVIETPLTISKLLSVLSRDSSSAVA